jgi:allantoate deiminase
MTSAQPARIAAFLSELAKIGLDSDGGWSRLAFGPKERQAHTLFVDTMSACGVTAVTDAVGNTVAVLPGAQELPRLATGSHLDTVYHGGNFDGAAGVVAAIEAIRVLSETGGLEHPVAAVVFAAEEGARFGAPCIGSRIISGTYDAKTLRSLVDKDGRSAYDCAIEVGLRPDRASSARWPEGETACFIEVHIEQGRVLEARNRGLGIVHSIGGSTRLELNFVGQADHSGSTPMWLRRDALVAAAEFVTFVERRARLHPTTVATVGRLEVSPNSLTTVPGSARLTLDVRDVDSDRQRELAEDLLDDAVRIGAARAVDVAARRLSDQSPVVLHTTVQNVLSSAADRLGISYITMPSGASHDAAQLARQIPTGMLFVPCKDGISHSPVEYADPAAIATAVDVLVQALRAIDDGSVV